MPSVLRGPLEAIPPLVATQIATSTGLVADRILVIARNRKRTPKLVGDQDILIRFRGFRTDGRDANRGRHNRRAHHRLEVTIRTRFQEIDREDTDIRWLTDAAKGNIVAWEAVANALEEFYPTDTAGNLLTDAGFYLTDCLESETDYGDKGWGETTLVYILTTRLPLTQLPLGQP